MTKVIAISGASGAGKTAVLQALSDYFACPSLYFDDHTESTTYPADMKVWFENGADLSEINTPTLVSSLTELIAQRPRYIFVEEPFGRERQAIAWMIDYVVLLDTPLELCLCRIIKRNADKNLTESMHSVQRYLARYEDHLRDIYVSTVALVRSNSDLIIKDPQPVSASVTEIANWLKSRESIDKSLVGSVL